MLDIQTTIMLSE